MDFFFLGFKEFIVLLSGLKKLFGCTEIEKTSANFSTVISFTYDSLIQR